MVHPPACSPPWPKPRCGPGPSRWAASRGAAALELPSMSRHKMPIIPFPGALFMKTEFIVSGMTCNHCVQTITRAVRDVAPDAAVQIDLAAHRVAIESSADAAVLRAAIAEEGYDVQPG